MSMINHPSNLSSFDLQALDAKRRLRILATPNDALQPRELSSELDWLPGQKYADYVAGEIINVENIRLSWVSADFFLFIPRVNSPFSFRRASGELITPRRMFTDGGSIPSLLQPIKGLSAWGFGPAYIIHDWLFDKHHCGDEVYNFEQTRDIMMEVVKTMMTSGLSAISEIIFDALYLGISSPIAWQYWNANSDTCPLPADASE